MDISSLAPVTAPAASASDAAQTAESDRTLGVSRFHAGVWVDLRLDGSWSRWRLGWVSSHSLLFMFTDGGGGSRSMTRSTLEHLIAQGAVRLVAEQSVLAGALDAVATRALRNTMDTGI